MNPDNLEPKVKDLTILFLGVEYSYFLVRLHKLKHGGYNDTLTSGLGEGDGCRTRVNASQRPALVCDRTGQELNIPRTCWDRVSPGIDLLP